MKAETFSSRLRALPSSRRESLAAIFRKADPGWPNPEASVGRYIGKNIWEATGPARDAFNRVAPRIKAYLDNAVEPISSRVTWSMYMVGSVPSLASPFIIFCCEVSGYRRDVQNTIKESGILDSYPGIKTDNLPRPPDFDQLVPLGANGIPSHNCGDMVVLTSQSRSACGSQILIDANGTKSVSSTPTATIGGVIRLGENFYYTTAAHAVSSARDSIHGDERLPADDDYGADEDALSFDANEDVCNAQHSNTRAEEIKPWHPPDKVVHNSDDDRYPKNELPWQWNLKSQHEEEEPLSPFTKAELSPNSTGRIFMTSMDEETRGVGLDYALIEMTSRHHVVENVIHVGPSKDTTVKVHSVVKSEPRDMDIVAVTPRGTIKGWISGTPVYSSTPGKRSYTRLFKAILNRPLQKGDCGTWVIDSSNGDLFGHVVLGSPGGGSVLFVPFSDIFDDILSRMGELPAFPMARDDESLKSTEKRISPSSRDDALARLIRKTISSIRELPEFPSGGDNDLYGRTPVSPIKSHPEPGRLSKSISINGHSEVSTKQSFSETGVKGPNASTKDDTTLTQTHSSHQKRTSQAASDKHDGGGDVSEDEELRRFMAQRNVEPYLQLEKPRQPPVAAEDNFSLRRDVTTEASPGILAPNPQPRNHIPSHNEPRESYEPPSDAKFRQVFSIFGNAPMRWEDTELLDLALREIDLDTIYSEAEKENEYFISEARSKGEDNKPEWGYQDCVIRALSRYFGRSFFTRIRKPPCESCPSKLPTIRRGIDQPTAEEKAGRAAVIELYQCAEEHCQAFTRFPRYWDARTLLRNPRGRAGESTNCFGVLCRALGARVRWVWNAEDNIWAEVYSEYQRRWVHVDPCEEAWDNPLLYAETMGKKMSYCIAFSSDGATDVTRRYVRSSRHALARTRCSEPELLRIIHDIRSKRRKDLSKRELTRLEMEDNSEEQELKSYVLPSNATGMADDWQPAEVKPMENAFSISTVNDLVTVRRLNLTGQSRHFGGQISDETAQKSIEALTKLDAEHNTVVGIETALDGLNEHPLMPIGRGGS